MAPESADLVVIGGGATGCSIACHAAERGLTVRIYDRGSVGSGTTGDSPGIVRSFYEDKGLAALAWESIRILRSWDRESGGACGFNPCGFMTGLPAGATASAREVIEACRDPRPSLFLIDPAEASSALPDLVQDGLAALVYEPLAGYCDAGATARYLSHRARRAGARIFEGVPVRGLLVERGAVRGVDTADGAVASTAVVNAAGAWAPHLATSFGFPLPIRVTLQGVATIAVAGSTPPGCGYSERALGFYMRPANSGHYLIGSLFPSDTRPATVEMRGATANAERLAHYAGYARKRLARFERGRIVGSRFSVFDETPDGNPMVGADPRVSGLWLAVGLSGHGFKFCPVLGQGIVDLVATGKTAHSFDPFDPTRFLR